LSFIFKKFIKNKLNRVFKKNKTQLALDGRTGRTGLCILNKTGKVCGYLDYAAIYHVTNSHKLSWMKDLYIQFY